MKKKTKFGVVLVLLILLGVLCWEFSKLAEMMKEEYQVVSSEVNPTESEETSETLISGETVESETESTEPTEEEAVKETFQEIIETVELVAVGDNLIHEGLYKTGMNSSGEWNYDHVYANVAEEIQAADLAIINK